MNQIGKAFLQGLATVLPVALTLYLAWLLAMGAERVMGSAMRWILPEGWYWPGTGLVLALVAITALGLVVRLPLMKLLLRLNDAIFRRIPIIKTLYSTISDFTDFVAHMQDRQDTGRPVKVRLWDNVELIGLVTDPDPKLADNREDGENHRVLVYLPMSYQLGGYTLLIERDRLEPVDMRMEDALRFILTAGVKGGGK
jgi:uncharacterized membrane protein